MAEGLKIRGVTYRNFDEVEKALKELGAQYALEPEDSDELDPLRNQIMDLLDALPDERAANMAQLLHAESGGGESATDDPPPIPKPATDDDIPYVEGLDVPPVCPMCAGHGTLAVEPPQDPTADQCPACDGYGTVFTGSRVPEYSIRACPTCAGRGFVPKTPDVPLPPPVARAADAPLWPGALWNPVTERWDAPEGEPPWGGARWNDMLGNYEQ